MSKFNDLYDVKELQESVKQAQENGGNGDYPEIPSGKYEVKIEKIELGETKNNVPMAKVQFRIIDGDYENSCLFYNQVLIGKDKATGKPTAFGIHNFNLFLNSLSLSEGINVVFKDFDQYEDLLLDCAEDVEALTYDLQYTKPKDENSFPKFKILKMYED